MSFIQLDHFETPDISTQAMSAPSTAIHEVGGNPRRELVSRAIAILRHHVNEPVTMAELSQMAGVSERTMRAAFHDVLGLSPKQYAISQRLRAAREALLAADPEITTVTDIATEFGFFELGRFAGRYRSVFGEVPSQTLQQVVAPWPGGAA